MSRGARPGHEVRLLPGAGFAELAIDRPDKGNAMSLAMRDAIADALERAEPAPDVSALLITSTGDDFMVGSDLRDLGRWSSHDHRKLDTARVWRSLASFSKPLIAVVRGRAWGGGCELALACDIVLIDGSATFAQPEVNVGLVPGAGGVQRLLRRVGRSTGMRMVLTGEPIDAATAARLGLAVLVDDPLAEARRVAGRIAALPPLAVRSIKELSRLVDAVGLDVGLEREREAFLALTDSEDKAEGIRAFFDRRPPQFTGR
jgi:enoyl-CoA hydratase